MFYKTVKEDGFFETEIKKSKFLTCITEVKTEEEALEVIKNTKKKYYDSTHVCSAYVLKNTMHSSDDGEPSGTAGKPILDVILGAELVNVVITVTRYFGGTLLGTGGLVRAYSGSASGVIKNSEIVTVKSGTLFKFNIDYSTFPKIEYICREAGIIIYEINYLSEIEFTVLLEDKKEFFGKVTDMTSGKIKEISATYKKDVNFYIKNGKVVLEEI